MRYWAFQAVLSNVRPRWRCLAGPIKLVKDDLSCELTRVELVCTLLFALWVLKVCEGEE